MDNNEFLTIQEFIQKYEVPDVRIRRRIRKYRLVDPQKLEGVLTERYDKGVGNVILLKEDFWVKELEAIAKETAYAVPLKRSEEALKRSDEPEPNRLSAEPTAYAVVPEQSSEISSQLEEPLKRSEEPKPNRRSAEPTAYAPDQITVDREFLEILKEDRAEKKDWIKKYESLLIDYKAKDNELVEREKFLQGLIEKIITDARNTKQLLSSQINHLQKQLQVPKKGVSSQVGEEVEFENGNFTESQENQNTGI
ncbi:MAG: hypothetical protein WC711_03085 [Candidatus Staskawiczbacteria bacterium]|jgi:hypothetical protein